MSLLSVLGLRPPARLQSAAAALKTLGSDNAANEGARSPGKQGRPGKPAPKGELVLGGASFERLSIGAEVSGPRLKTLWVLLASDGSGPIGADEGWSLAETNRKAVEIQALFSRMRDLQTRMYEDHGSVESAAKQSVSDVAKLRKAAAAVGSRSKGSRGKDLREGVEGYVEGIDNVQDKLREWPLCDDHATQGGRRPQGPMGQIDQRYLARKRRGSRGLELLCQGHQGFMRCHAALDKQRR